MARASSYYVSCSHTALVRCMPTSLRQRTYASVTMLMTPAHSLRARMTRAKSDVAEVITYDATSSRSHPRWMLARLGRRGPATDASSPT